MKVTKINDKKIVITLTESELFFDYDLEVAELIDAAKKTEVSRKLLDIVNEAAHKYNIEVVDGMSVKIMLNALNEIIIEADFDATFNSNNLNGMAKFFNSLYETMSVEEVEEVIDESCKRLGLSDEEMDSIYSLMKSAGTEEYNTVEESVNKEDLTYIFSFKKLDDIITISSMIKKYVEESTLYKVDDKYYIELHIVPNSDNKILNILSEFLFKRDDNIAVEYILEHGNAIISGDAIDKLSSI